MKAFALGRRAKWKDYVDLYYLAKDYHSLTKIMKRTNQLFGEEFSEKMFRGQISYFDDLDYSEEVIYLGDPVPQETIKNFLVDAATEKF